MRHRLNLLREFSVPLIVGVLAALGWVNLAPEAYHHFLHAPVLAGLTCHFASNDLFMTLFFGIAAVEITQSCLPGGDLYPLNRAVNPLLATAGGVLGPVLCYLVLNRYFGSPPLARGWGIPTATDIALAWLGARFVFGRNHPVIAFLLLLAVADDAIGLAIIAIFYGDPSTPAQPHWLLLTVAAMALAYLMRRLRIMSYWPYLVICGTLSWFGLHLAHLHPALALVFVIPFIPCDRHKTGHVFEVDDRDLSPLAKFEHDWKLTVDLGLFMFGLVNGGVAFSAVGTVTWLVLAALIAGKAIGIFALASLAIRLGFPLPKGMGTRELLATGFIAGIGFTVALFVAGEAFVDPVLAGGAKMGAMLSLLAVAPAALVANSSGKKVNC